MNLDAPEKYLHLMHTHAILLHTAVMCLSQVTWKHFEAFQHTCL